MHHVWHRCVLWPDGNVEFNRAAHAPARCAVGGTCLCARAAGAAPLASAEDELQVYGVARRAPAALGGG